MARQDHFATKYIPAIRKMETEEDPITEAIRDMLPVTLSRLAAGLPMHELDVIVKEAMACEDAL